MLIHSPIDSYLSCLQFFAVTSNANKHSYMCLLTYICSFPYRTYSGGGLLACRHEHLHLYSCQIALWRGWRGSIFFHYRILFCQSGEKWYLTVVFNCIVLSLDILCLFSTHIFCSFNWLSTFFFFNSIVCVCLLVFKSSSCILHINTLLVISIISKSVTWIFILFLKNLLLFRIFKKLNVVIFINFLSLIFKILYYPKDFF